MIAYGSIDQPETTSMGGGKGRRKDRTRAASPGRHIRAAPTGGRNPHPGISGLFELVMARSV
jgi:hypothetical protein